MDKRIVHRYESGDVLSFYIKNKERYFIKNKFFIVFPIILALFALIVAFSASACTNENVVKENSFTSNTTIVAESTNATTHIHSFVQNEIYPPTCIEDGKNISMCECGEETEEIIKSIGHTFEDEIEYATCTKDGYYNRICFACGYVENVEKYKATRHNYGDWNVEKDSTKFETGIQSRVCKNCGNKEEKIIEKKELYPIIEQGDGYTITITKEWYENAWVYAAHLQFDDYDMMKTGCANGKYNNGYETTSHFANRVDSILAINGCYSAPYLNYTVVRDGVVWNGGNRSLCLPAVYNQYTGILETVWEGIIPEKFKNKTVGELVANKMITDTFCFGPPSLVNGINLSNNGGNRAQKTFIK